MRTLLHIDILKSWPLKSCCLRALLVLLAVCAVLIPTHEAASAPSSNFPTLQPGFDNDFRFTNSLNLKGKLLFTAKIGAYERILMLDFATQRITKVIDGPGNNSFSVWSPDGKQIAFVSDRDGNKEIYLSDSDGGNQKRVTNNPGLEDHPSWAPGGSELLYLSEDAKAGKSLRTNIISYSVKTGEIKKLTELNGKNSTPQMSPDKKMLAYTTNRFWPGWDVCLYNFATKSESCPLSGTSTYCRPAWSHDGSYLAYSSGLGGIDAGLLKLSDMSTTELFATDGDDYDLHWTADDKIIIFAADAETSDIYNLYAIEVANEEKDVTEERKAVPLLRSGTALRFPNLWQPK